MLSPSSPAQKNLGEEDSSGSDAGSELSLEPETDRFGFIVTNGSTAGSAGPPPELVKVQCQKGIPASLRAKCWPLLCGATDRMKPNEKLYETLDSQPALQSWVDVIERDLDRQFPFHEMFLSKDGHGQRGLFRVLKAYTQYQPEEGYCQAQGPVAAVLLMNMPAEEAFWCLVQISEKYLPGYYSPLLEGVLFDAAMLTWVLKRTCPAAHKHLQHHGVEPLMFATDWLMCLFTRHLPFNTLLRVWDLFFCYGVRVLLQVAVVLVRRVLGRAEQRKQCPGQMETLEKLRGVREQVQDEDDAFIAEVCSVALSARDLEKHTEKELQKWRKDRPSSTFDPRGRCHGYRTVWARARQSEEEREKKEREKGNLSVPLARSASTLSLSPSILHKKWKKGGKANAGDWEGGGGGGRIERHLSMGAKEDCRSWSELHFKKVQGVQEEEDVDEHKKQSEAKPAPQSEQKEPEKTENIQTIPTEQAEETVTVKVHNEQEETFITEKEESQCKETEENKMLPEQTEETVRVNVYDEQEEIIIITKKEESQVKETEENKMLPEQTEETNVETEPTKSPIEDQTAEHIVAQGEELDSNNQSQDQSNDQDIEVDDTNNETEEPEAESEPTAAVEENQTEIQTDADADTNTEVEMEESVHPSEEHMDPSDVKPEESAENENVQQTQVGSVREVPATANPGSETGDEVEAPAVKDCTVETGTQQQQEEVIAETDRHSQGDAFERKYHSAESLTETDMKEESHTQTVTETDVQVQTQEKVEENAATQDDLEAEIVEIDSNEHVDSKTEAETLILCTPDCIQPEEGTDLKADAEAEAETPVSNDTVRESSEAQCSEEEEGEATACEPTQEREEIILPAHSEVENDQTQAAETEPKEEIPDSLAPPQEAVTSAQGEEVSLSAEPDGMSSAGMTTTEEPAPEQPKSEDTLEAVEEEKSTDNVEENTEDDVFISTEPTDSNADSKTQVQDKESCLVKDPTEPNNSVLPQATGRRNSRSSGDFCVRKSSSSRGSRLGRRLSQDLFTVPQKTSQSTPDEPEVKHTESQSSTEAVNPTQTPTKVTSEVASSLSEEATERTELQQEPLPANPPKRFGLFRRLKGEQPKKTKMQVPKILIQDFSDQTGTEKLPDEEGEEKLSSRERRRRRRERERREKEEERLRKKREKELEKERERERRKPQTRGKSFQVQKEKGSSDEPQPRKTGPRMLRNSASYAESYF
ncbi:Carabin TBC1 domain family member 10C [Larimichthys crocea]|uniref:Carabin TBC1 domain family member 10C n=1 Tax=Larimichthys crocea TaxID=215358 RepID=A0A6G0I3K4_LARCR|nr:Carabin TBC1 domain family member 10C [Larimichthys crocea]